MLAPMLKSKIHRASITGIYPNDEGLFARILRHEIDHCDGVLIGDKEAARKNK